MNNDFASFDTLLRQASGTADTYLVEALESVEKRFSGATQPQKVDLVIAFMKIAAADFDTSCRVKLLLENIGPGLDAIGEGLSAIAYALENQGPLV